LHFNSPNGQMIYDDDHQTISSIEKVNCNSIVFKEDIFCAMHAYENNKSLYVELTKIELEGTPALIRGEPQTRLDQDTTYSFTPITDEFENDLLIFSIENQPSWANFNIETGELSGTPTKDNIGNTENIIISVNDGAYTSKLNPFNIEVVEVISTPPIKQTDKKKPSGGSLYFLLLLIVGLILIKETNIKSAGFNSR